MSGEQSKVPVWRRKIQGTWLGRMMNSKVGNFAIVGVFGVVYGAVIIHLARGWGWNPNDANDFQAWTSIVMNFTLSYFFTWDDSHFLSFQKHLIRFVFAKVVTYKTNEFLFDQSLFIYQQMFGSTVGPFLTTDTMAYLASTAIITLLNFPIMNSFVFGKNDWRTDLDLTILGIMNLPGDITHGILNILSKVRK